MKNCQNCIHGKTSFEFGMNSIESMDLLIENKDSVLGNMYGICMDGKQDIFKEWWKNSINVPSDKNPNVPCYVPTELSVRTNKMIGLLDEELDILKNNEK